MPKLRHKIDPRPDLEAGYELDVLVAREVMGWVKDEESHYWVDGERKIISVPSFSKEIEFAWEVVEKMESDGFRWMLTSRNPIMSDLKIIPCCRFLRYGDGVIVDDGIVDAPTAPLAICRAALKAVDAQTPS